MNTLGWQIGAFLIGASALIIAVYIGKLLNTTNKVVEKVYKIIDYNERQACINWSFIPKCIL